MDQYDRAAARAEQYRQVGQAERELRAKRAVQAVRDGDAAALGAAIDDGDDLRAESVDGMPLLHYACAGGHAAVVEILLERRCVDPLERRADGLSAVGVAVLCDHIDVVRAYARWVQPLPEMTIRSNTLVEGACARNCVPMLRVLIDECGCAAQPPAPFEMSPLICAAIYNAVDALRYLLGTGAVDVDAVCAESTNALRAACERGHMAAVRVLLDAGADVCATNARGLNALMVAADHGHVELVRLLMTHAPAALDQRTTSGSSALTFACQGGALQVVREIAEHLGAAAHPVPGERWPELRIALYRGHAHIAEYLQQMPGYEGDPHALVLTQKGEKRHLAASLPLARRITSLTYPCITDDALGALACCLPASTVQALYLPNAWCNVDGVAALAAALPNSQVRTLVMDEVVVMFAHLERHPSLVWRRTIDAAGPWTPGRHALYPARLRVHIVELLLLARPPRVRRRRVHSDVPTAARCSLIKLPTGVLLVLFAAMGRLNYWPPIATALA